MKPLFDEHELRDLNSRRFHPEDPRWGSERTSGAVLFGAGGVGRFFLRFMRLAGCEPAFFVDNNAALWGQRVEGVEVRPPEALRGDAERTVVMCTATYLKKFAEQSRHLGLHAVVPYYHFCHPPFPFVAATAAQTAEILTGAAPLRAAAVWADDASRDAYKGTLAFRVTQDFADLPPHAGGEYFLPELFRDEQYARFVDGGAFDGDTLNDFLRVTGGRFAGYEAFEPDPVNFAALERAVAALAGGTRDRIRLHRLALGATAGEACFQGWGNACSAVGEGGALRVAVAALDDILAGGDATFVKLDVEGAEPEALLGMERTIRRCRPALAVCVYHAVDHLWLIPSWIAGLGLGYRLYLRRHSESYSETVCYAVP